MKYFLYILISFNFYASSFTVSQAADLIEVYKVAIKNDPELLASEAKHQANMQEYPIARSFLLPNLNFNASSQRTRESIDGSVYGSTSATSQYTTDEYSINLKQPLYRRDLFTLLEKSEYIVAKSVAVRDSARQELIIRVAEAYFGILEEYQNNKLGSYLLSEAIKESLNKKNIERVWLHTCSLDHKNALNNYLARGMKIFKTEIINI